MPENEDYETARLLNGERLLKAMDETARAAAAAGLTPEILAELLADECNDQSKRLYDDDQEKQILDELSNAADTKGWV